MSRALADALEKLLAAAGASTVANNSASAIDSGAKPAASLAASCFTPAQRRALDQFARQTGALRIITQGRGSSYQVTDHALLTAHVQRLRPHSEAQLNPTLPARTNNIARTRNSKGRASAHQGAYLLLKAISSNVLWQRGDGAMFDLSRQTELAGAAALAITPSDAWQTQQPLWLVENQALFDRLDWLPEDAHGSIVYYGGQLNTLFLDWLAQAPRTPKIFFFPDYDGVGLLNYARLVEKSRAEVEFWLMPGWLKLLQTYGNQQVWENTSAQFHAALARLEKRSLPPALSSLCQALALHGLALEHEAVWL